MKKSLPLIALSAMLFMLFFPPRTLAQGNIDWETIWEVLQPTSNTGTYGWMAGQRQYTGLAYDKWRDVLYIANPAICSFGGVSYTCPKIHIWDANSGAPNMNVGRAPNGQGGQVPVPPDTVQQGTLGWPNGSFGSFSQGQFGIYKIDLDDEGRIFACNLVSPIWGICFPGPPPNCLPEYLAQGPFRVYRWDTPRSSPKRAYATLNGSHTGIGSGIDDPFDAHQLSEMTYTRWGDVLEVVGLRNYLQTPDGPVLVDSARIFTSGGPYSGQKTETNREINVMVTDSRQTGIGNGIPGQRLDYRLGVRLISSKEGIASHGIAATGMSAISEIWMDNGCRVTTLNNQGQLDPIPQNITMTRDYALSSDPFTGTGLSGALAFFSIPQTGKKFLVCADAYPTDPNDPTAPNYNTRARVMDITISGAENRFPCLGDTPYLGNRLLSPNSGACNYVSDVDYKLEGDPSGNGYHVILFVLMSNNGIAAYRSHCIIVPVEMTTFRGRLSQDAVELQWTVTLENNNRGFEVERSFDNGTTWETIGFVQGRGTATSGKEYTYSDPVTDQHRALGSVQYRLRQIDNDGTSNLTQAVSILVGGAPSSVLLDQNYPNPFNPNTTISYQLSKPGFVTLKVYNTVGDELATLVNEEKNPGAYTVTFTSGNLPSGTYIYRINVNGQILEKKMVVMK